MLPFGEISARFKLIDSDTASVFIPSDEKSKELADSFYSEDFSKALFRKASAYCVNIYTNEFHKLISEGNAIQISDNFAVLTNENLYSSESGLKIYEISGDAFII